MKRLLIPIITAALCIISLGAATGIARATPVYEVPERWAYQALSALAADGLLDGYPDQKFQGDRPRTRREMAQLIARAVSKLQVEGAGTTPAADLTKLQQLMDAYRYELVLLGVRVTNVDDIAKPVAKNPKSGHTFQVHDSISADASFRGRTAAQTIAGGHADPFVNAFLTSPDNNSPFEHSPAGGTTLRFDGKISPTYTFNDNVSISLPVHLIQYNGPFNANDRYLVQSSLVFNIGKIGALRNVYLRGGQLDDMESSRLGLAFRAPDATQQGPGFQNPVQPYENGVEAGGTINGLTRFQVSWSRMEPSYINTTLGFGDDVANNNYFLVVTPSNRSAIQPGAPGATAGNARTDSFVASAGPILSVFLSQKAALGTVYISAVNGVVCTPAGQRATGGPCPIGRKSWFYSDQTNQVIFMSALPAGSTVQVSYGFASTGGDFPVYNVQFRRDHFNARLNQQFKGFPGAELGFSLSRIVDAQEGGDTPGKFGNGFGLISNTVFGLDGRLPLWFLRYGPHRSEHPVLFAEGAYSKYTPDVFNTAPITDSALASGLRMRFGGATATVQYQVVGPDFMSGAPIRYLGPAPATFQMWHGNFFPQFFGFANNLAINQTFQSTVTPGCAGAACSTQNARLTYIYPVFNPFVAGGPQFFSAFAPNSRGFTERFTLPIGNADVGNTVNLMAQHLTEMVPNGFGQITYGPGFASDTRLNFSRIQAGVHVSVPLAERTLSVNLNGSMEHLFRKDLTAYSYVPFDSTSGGPDSASAAALNAYLSITGHTPVLFYPNFVDEFRRTFEPSFSVPLATNMNVNFAYNMQSYRGAYGTTRDQNISEEKNDAYATLTYSIPKTNGSIALLFGNQKYTDNVLSSYNFSQNHEALDFTIRF